MKKILCLAIVLLLALTVFVACGNTETTTAETTTTKTETTTTAAKPADTTAAKPADTTAEKPADTTAEKPADTTAEKPADTTVEKPGDDEPTTPTLPTLDADSVNLYDQCSITNLAIEDHHAQHNNNPAFAFALWNNVDLYLELRGNEYESLDAWSNPKYEWVLTVNGEYFEPLGFSLYDADNEYGFFRIDLGPMSDWDYQNKKFSYAIDLYIIDVATGKVAYYALISEENGPVVHNLGMIEDESRPSTVTKVEGVTCVSGPDKDGVEGAAKAFDGEIKTKICTGDNNTPIVANLGGAKTLKGISLVNANDNSGSNGRTVINFEVWVSADGENWGDAAAWSTDGAGVNKGDVSDDFMERYYSFGKDITATYVKIVVNNGEMYQMSEIIFFE